MSRMRPPCGRGGRGSRPVSSPVDANMIGRPVTPTTDNAAPLRASPSSLVRTTPSTPTCSLNSTAVLTASWPIIASTTNRVSAGRHGVPYVAQLAHQFRVDGKPARGVDDDDVVQLQFGFPQRAAGHVDGIADPVAGFGREHHDPGLLAHDLELIDRVRPLQVGGHEHRLMSLILQVLRQLARQGRLAGPFAARRAGSPWWGLGELQPLVWLPRISMSSSLTILMTC